MRIIDHLVESIRRTAEYNPAVQASPFCILWPDKERQWEKVISRLQLVMPELFVLGSYKPEERCGPAIWLRCVVAGKAPEVSFEKETIPIFYLPGISRQDLRAIEQCVEELKPLAELQYRSALWSQVNARDWSVFAYFKSEQGGLGLDIAKDQGSLDAIQLALPRLLDEDVLTFTQTHLDKEFFTSLLAGNDVARDVLKWLSDDDFRGSRTEEEWQAFGEVCRMKYYFDPHKDTTLTGAEKLVVRDGAWQQVWDRFCEAPAKYEHIPALIRRNVMPIMDFDASSWPQANEQEETKLRVELGNIVSMTSPKARERLLQLESIHGERREWIWAELGEAPLALALVWLVKIATITQSGVAGTFQSLIDGYSQSGWQADDAALQALACVHKQEDINVIITVLQCVYQPWLEEGAKQLQDFVRSQGYPGETVASKTPTPDVTGECILFIDGLRFDMAKRLIGLCHSNGFATDGKIYWAALPSVTATGKPAVMPIDDGLYGDEVDNAEFEPSIQATGAIASAAKLHKIVTDSGWTIFSFDSNASLAAKGWMEGPSIDDEGHHHGRKMAYQLDKMLKEIADKVQILLDNGWHQVRVVTDHGWLLMPGGLPKVELPKALSDVKWGRCAMLKAGAASDESLYPWYWNPHVQIAMANGISCYRNGMEYTHGGLSLQECLLLELTVGEATTGRKVSKVVITDVAWKRMRCNIVAEVDFTGLSADLRLQPGNPESSIAVNIKLFNTSGVASLVVEDDGLEGKAVAIVLLDSNGQVVMQQMTIVGGNQ